MSGGTPSPSGQIAPSRVNRCRGNDFQRSYAVVYVVEKSLYKQKRTASPFDCQRQRKCVRQGSSAWFRSLRRQSHGHRGHWLRGPGCDVRLCTPRRHDCHPRAVDLRPDGDCARRHRVNRTSSQERRITPVLSLSKAQASALDQLHAPSRTRAATAAHAAARRRRPTSPPARQLSRARRSDRTFAGASTDSD